ncbi:hypothetical protein [Spirillospora albida]|uniref:hypothetical protein n=1 Tax=Spirillospora albida TaxID=58123 RepID=UPI0012F83F44|nr:hypothetical protein [Spirillospora albida]
MLNGLHVGYLWAGTDEVSAGFVRRNQYLTEAISTPLVWNRRLRESFAQGLPAREAIRQWIGRPEDPVGGGVPAGAREEVLESRRALARLANPDEEESPLDSLVYGELPDGTPLDRSEGWGALTVELPPFYDMTTEGPVRYLPLTGSGVTLGYLWAGVTGNAALFEPRADAGAFGADALSAWILRLRDLYGQDVPASEILNRCRALPADPAAGTVPPGTAVQEAPTLDDLRRRAAVHEQSLPLSRSPRPEDVEVWTRPGLEPGEREAVLRYLRDAPIVLDNDRLVPDELDRTRPRVVPHTYHTDGTWVWQGGVPYQLEQRDIAPEDGLLQHIRSRGYQLPPADPAIVERGKHALRMRRILVPPPS